MVSVSNKQRASRDASLTGLSRLRGAASVAYLCHGLAVVLCIVALLACARLATTVTDRLPHLDDEVAYLFQARTLASGHLMLQAPARPEFFMLPFTLILDGHWIGKYTPGYPAVLALGVLSGYPWLLNPVVGAFNVGLVYLLGRRLYGVGTALLAAALLVASPFFLLQASSFMSHNVALFWALLFLLGFTRLWQSGGLGAALLAGGSLGMLFLSRPFTAVGLGLPAALWALGAVLRDWRKLRVYLPVVAAFLPFVAILLVYNQLTTGAPLRFAYQLYWPYDTIGYGPSHGNVGFTFGDGLHDTRTKLSSLSWYLFGWPHRLSLLPGVVGAVVALAALARAGYRRLRGQAGCQVGATTRTTWDLLLLSLVLGMIAIHITYWGNDLYHGPRYYFEVMGAIVLLSSRGLVRLSQLLAWLASRLGAAGSVARRGAMTVVLLGSLLLTHQAYTGFAPATFRYYVNWYNINRAGIEHLQSLGLHNAVVFVTSNENPYAWPDFIPYYFQDSLSLDGDVVYAEDQGDELDRQLMELYPGRDYYRYWHGQLTHLGRS